jgi:lipoprotein-anchoring transpeptidase ErfK/SrfK
MLMAAAVLVHALTALGARGPGAEVSDMGGQSARPVVALRPEAPALRAMAGASRRVADAPASRPGPALLVRIRASIPIRARPGSGRAIGVMPPRSRYLGTPTVAWVLQTSTHGGYGQVTVPYSGRTATGWIPLKGLERIRTPYLVRIDLSRHQLTVERRGRRIFRVLAATGAPWSPTPAGRYFVTDRVAVYAGSPFGSFAFGISGIQTRLPPGWGGSGDQLAIHGTNSPSTIGRSVSAGCVRVSEPTLARLKPILQLGTPVIIQP